ncbi:unnamed protein product [Caenorhabditis bovis]|uniref:Uncharacterized protein n=1 Tax=Caenorhabditis bovis TaxID=2654633 RepID=A0A8S1FF96_9PELO|nr:unnamed protein product [Caenorhabditis bovis]
MNEQCAAHWGHAFGVVSDVFEDLLVLECDPANLAANFGFLLFARLVGQIVSEFANCCRGDHHHHNIEHALNASLAFINDMRNIDRNYRGI